jgi:RsiW-degrading membrane proteinase PrsW (M82 family)
MFAILIGFGTGVLVLAFGSAVVAYPIPMIAAVVLFGLHGAVLVWILHTVDYLEPEPVPMLAAALAWGGLVATGAALRANLAGEEILTRLFPPAFVRAWGAAIEGPTNEEILKSLGIVALLLIGRRHVNSVMDGVVYGGFVGLGFQEVENLTYTLNVAASQDTNTIGPAWQMFLIRGLLAGLWSHTVYSAIVGAGIAYAVLRTDRPRPVRAGAVVAAFAIGWSAHFLWNSPLLTGALATVGGDLGVLFAMVVKGGLVLGTLLVIIHFARRTEYQALTGHLRALANPMLATPAEIDALRTARLRAIARWNAYVRGGWTARRATRRLQRYQADVSVALAGNQPPPPQLDALYATRRLLFATGVGEADAVRAPRTWAGRFSILAALATAVLPFLVVVPIGIAAWSVRRARRSRRTADVRTLTAAVLAVVLAGSWLVAIVVNRSGIT